ncbi:MAG: acyl carrier protein [Eubacterium sp.]|nr:acyl carrier protein [Eubacterium sp.]
MLDKIREIMVAYVDVDAASITADSRLGEDLGLTSFAVMSMMGDFEEAFDITVDESELTGIFTVGDIMKYIESKQ